MNDFGVEDKMSQVLKYHKMVFKTKFTMPHCWDMIKDCPKWQELYNSMKKGARDGSKKRANDEAGDDANPDQSSGGQAVRSRGHKSSAQDVKREAAAQLEESSKTLIAGKEESTAARYVEKRKDKEEAMGCYLEMTRKKLEIEQERIKA